MRKLFLLSLTLGLSVFTFAQTQKNYRLTVVAEGNFGTPNGDLFQVEGPAETPTIIGPMYQNANNLSAGIDVLQDFDHWQTKAMLCGKGGHPTKLAVVHYPSMDTVFTVNSGLGAGLQRCGMVSDHKGYIVGANSSAVKFVDIDNQTINSVTDPGAHFASGIHSMIGYNGTMYIANGTKVVTIDTLTQSTTDALVTGLTGINTMVKDTANQCLWLLGKVGTTNAIVKIEVNNNNTVAAPILLTGFTNAKLLRVGPNKLYFVSGTGFFVYDLSTQVIPSTAIYTSNFTGFSVMYDRSFTVDPVSGDFAYTTAAAYTAPGLFEIVDGTSFSRIDSGATTGAAIPNELFLTTWISNTNPQWDTATLADLYAECDITLTAPIALFGNTPITASTNQMNYNNQGSYIIEWKYVSGNDSIIQNQYLNIADTTAPLADSLHLANLSENCPFTLIPPTATDNCEGQIIGTTDSLTFTIAGIYTIQWTYTDSLGNSSTQEQQLEIICEETNIKNVEKLQANIYPNPANTSIAITLTKKDHYQIALINALGQVALEQNENGDLIKIDVAHLPEGLYFLTIKSNNGAQSNHKVLIKH